MSARRIERDTTTYPVVQVIKTRHRQEDGAVRLTWCVRLKTKVHSFKLGEYPYTVDIKELRALTDLHSLLADFAALETRWFDSERAAIAA